MEEVVSGMAEDKFMLLPEKLPQIILRVSFTVKRFRRVDKDHKEFGHEVTIVTMQMLEALLRERFREINQGLGITISS